MAIFAYGLARAPRLEQRLWLAGVIDALAGEQIPYFETRFVDLGIDPAAFEPMPSAVAEFRDGMLKIAADGTYADVIVAMLAAEWMYATWCGRAAAVPISDPDLARWVALHAEPAFVAQAERLRSEADAIGAAASPAGRQRLNAVFREALALEIAFHSAPYQGSGG
jgi:thiaminase/transcriptional activator TenA